MCELCNRIGNADGFEMHCDRLDVEYIGWGNQANHFRIDGVEHYISWHTYEANPAQFDKLVKAIREAGK